jgi:hypothetical protein
MRLWYRLTIRPTDAAKMSKPGYGNCSTRVRWERRSNVLNFEIRTIPMERTKQCTLQFFFRDSIMTHPPIDLSPEPTVKTSCLACEQRILGLFASGSDVAAIVKDVYGVASSAGRPYQDKSREVQQALRAALGAR